MGDIKIDKEVFQRRMKKFYLTWKDAGEESPLSKIDAVVVAVGTAEVVYSKSIAFQIWLFGYEVPDTVMVMCESAIYVLSSKKKLDFIQQFEGNNKDGALPPFKFLTRDKKDKDTANMQSLVEAIKASSKGKTIGVFIKDKWQGDAFLEVLDNAVNSASLEKVDVSSHQALIMAPKEEVEHNLIKKASMATMDLYNKFLREQLMDLIDKEKRVKHSKLASQVEEAAQNKKYITGLDLANLDTCYRPIIQSGGNYQLKFSAAVDEKLLHFGSIVCMLGLKYKFYCSNIARTLMVGPSDEMQKNFAILLKAQEEVISILKHGVKLCDVYAAAVKVVQNEKPELVEKMTKNVGFAMGIEFRESSLLIAAKNDEVAVKGMSFNINLGFGNLLNEEAKDEEGKIYSLFIGDTVVVNDQDTPATVLTPQRRQVKHACIFLKEEDDIDEDVEEEKENNNDTRGRGQRSAVLTTRTRTEMSAEEKRYQHQKELSEKLHQNALERNAGHKGKDDEKKDRKVCASYKNDAQYPYESDVVDLKFYVDKRHETVIMPASGVSVPFHICTLKNISTSVEGDYTYLRLNFFYPGANLGRNEGIVYPVDAGKLLKEMTYRGSNSKEPGELSAPCANLNTAFRLIKDVQKKFKTREAEEREKEGITKQDTLIINPNRGNPKLKDLYIRPNILSKRITGQLEAHTNGFRFTSIRGDKVDILYNNIKTAFFQPCDSEIVILLHFHLKNAILFGKKKHVDVQFYTEVGEVTTDLGKHQHSHDRDDLRAEQSERELRHRLKAAFKSFCEKVEAMAKGEVEFDVPFRELGFHGAPNRSTVLIQPTSGSVVNLTEWPPFVVSLDEVELVHFERVQFHLKNFDMVFVFKDYHKKVASITAIPMAQLDPVKEWLNSCDIKYSEGIQSLNWTKIMKTITDDPNKFFEDGGWSFLDPESDAENEDDDDDEEDDAYDPSDSVSDEESSEGDSDDSNWSAEDDDDSEEELGSSEESGKDWDELEEEAKRADEEVLEEDEDDRKHKKSKPSSSSKHHSSKHLSPKKKHKSSHHDSHKQKNGHASHSEKSSMKRKHSGGGHDRSPKKRK